MFRIGRNQDVRADIHAGARAFFERDDGQAIEEVIQYLFAFDGGLLGDAIANLRGRVKDAAVVADLREAAQAADSGGGGERLQIAVIYLRCKAGRPDLVKADVLVANSSENPSGQMARWKVTNILRCWALPTLCTSPSNRVPCGKRSC